MPLYIGTDEAGYGPNLGPLLIGLSAWQIPAELPEEKLVAALDSWVVNGFPGPQDSRIPLADSKELYQPARGLEVLESAALAVGRILGWQPTNWHEIAELFTAVTPQQPWDREFNFPLPLQAAEDQVLAWQELLAEGLRLNGIELKAWRARMVQPLEFNQRVAELGSKGTLLSETTLGLVAETISAEAHADPVFVMCDKHGGRDRYAAVLTHVFADCRLQVVKESRSESAYRMHWQDTRIEICFRSQGERSLPTALASMSAKYLRELAMHAFNQFWQREVPGIQPTAGYPADAKRFWETIRERQLALKIEDDVLWRQR